MKLTSSIVLLLIACNSIAEINNDLGDTLASYPNYGTDKTEECYSVNQAARKVSNLKKKGLSAKEIEAGISADIKNGEIPAEAKTMYMKIVEAAYLPENIDKVGYEFSYEIKVTCLQPEEGDCDSELNAVARVAEIKAGGGSLYEVQQKRQELDGAISMTHDELFNLAFWPENIDKTAQEYIDFVTDVWCKKTKSERSILLENRLLREDVKQSR